MKQNNRILISIFTSLLILCPLANAQSNYKPIIYNAYINGDMTKWGSVIAAIEKQIPQTTEAKLELISY